MVAPHAGAWIETPEVAVMQIPQVVAPHAGAWIETLDVIKLAGLVRSLPTRERGLKLTKLKTKEKQCWSLPTRERGLKHTDDGREHFVKQSLTTRERGLKQTTLSKLTTG